MYISINIGGVSQVIEEKKLLDELFLFKVKQLDEFIERFNKNDSTLLLKYLENEENQSLSRSQLIKSLFKNDQDWTEDAGIFIDDIVENQYNLNFNDINWYAELECLFSYNEENYLIRLFLQTCANNTGTRWIITSVDSNLFDKSSKFNKNKIINPVSHSTDFLGLHKAFKDTTFLTNYFHPDFKPNQLTSFYIYLKSGNLILQQVNKITYHFLQFKNWIFTINNYHRPNKNSGWLIDNLLKVDDELKIKYKEEILKINN